MLRLQSLFVTRALPVFAVVLAGSLAFASAEARSQRDYSDLLQWSNGFSLLGSYLAGRVASEEKNFEEAAEYFRRALARDPDNDDMLGEAFKTELAAGNMSEAVSLARRLTDGSASTSGFALLLLGTDALKRGQYDQAISRFQTVSDSPIIKLTDQLARAWAEFGSGRRDQALQTLSVAPNADSSGYFQQLHRALAADLAGQPEKARENYQRVFKRHSNNRRLVEAYARHAAARGDDKLLEEILGPYNDTQSADGRLSDLYAKLKKADDPKLLVTSAREGLAEVYFGIGGVLASEQATSPARFYLQLALYTRPDLDQASHMLGEIETSDKRLEAALEAYRDVGLGSPLYLDAQIRAAFILNALDRSEDGIALLTEKAIEVKKGDTLWDIAQRHYGSGDRYTQILRNNDDLLSESGGIKPGQTLRLPGLLDATDDKPRVLQAVGNILRDREDYARAAEYYSRAIEIIGTPSPEHWMYYYARGICYERLKQWDMAEADLEKALELNPDEASVMNYLGYSWVDQDLYLEKAMDMIREAVRREPNNGYYVDSLGWAHYKLGRYDKAVEHLEKAVELRPEDPTLNDHLGDAYWQVGRKREARFQWKNALSLDPEPEDRKQIEEKLANGLDDGNRKAELDESGAASVQ